MVNVPQSARAEQHDARVLAFVGYPNIEDWARQASPYRLVYLYMLPQSRTVDGVRRPVESWVIHIQQRDADGVIHYCRIPVLPITAPMAKEIENLAMGYLRLVGRWLKQAHYDLVPGLYAEPIDLRLVETACPMIDWDAIGSKFVRTDDEGETE